MYAVFTSCKLHARCTSCQVAVVTSGHACANSAMRAVDGSSSYNCNQSESMRGQGQLQRTPARRCRPVSRMLCSDQWCRLVKKCSISCNTPQNTGAALLFWCRRCPTHTNPMPQAVIQQRSPGLTTPDAALLQAVWRRPTVAAGPEGCAAPTAPVERFPEKSNQ